jgi:hypothetical protein
MEHKLPQLNKLEKLYNIELKNLSEFREKWTDHAIFHNYVYKLTQEDIAPIKEAIKEIESYSKFKQLVQKTKSNLEEKLEVYSSVFNNLEYIEKNIEKDEKISNLVKKYDSDINKVLINFIETGNELLDKLPQGEQNKTYSVTAEYLNNLFTQHNSSDYDILGKSIVIKDFVIQLQKIQADFKDLSQNNLYNGLKKWKEFIEFSEDKLKVKLILSEFYKIKKFTDISDKENKKSKKLRIGFKQYKRLTK